MDFFLPNVVICLMVFACLIFSRRLASAFQIKAVDSFLFFVRLEKAIVCVWVWVCVCVEQEKWKHKKAAKRAQNA
jgi:hypothetical protein